MSYLDKLLEGVEVEWKALGDITLPTNNIRWKDNHNTYRYIDLTSVSRDSNSITETSEINANNAPSRAQKIVLKDDVIFATTRPAQQRLCLIDDEYSGQIASTGYCILRAKTEVTIPKWIFFHLASIDFKKFVEENQSGSAYPAISDAKVKEYIIPIPCPENRKKSLEIQNAIIRILDSFTELTLTIESSFLILRKQRLRERH
jgi:type I restriction enzyme S subunit